MQTIGQSSHNIFLGTWAKIWGPFSQLPAYLKHSTRGKLLHESHVKASSRPLFWGLTEHHVRVVLQIFSKSGFPCSFAGLRQILPKALCTLCCQRFPSTRKVSSRKLLETYSGTPHSASRLSRCIPFGTSLTANSCPSFCVAKTQCRQYLPTFQKGTQSDMQETRRLSCTGQGRIPESGSQLQTFTSPYGLKHFSLARVAGQFNARA